MDFMQISENYSYIHRVDLLDFRCLWNQLECYDQCTLDGNAVLVGNKGPSESWSFHLKQINQEHAPSFITTKQIHQNPA